MNDDADDEQLMWCLCDIHHDMMTRLDSMEENEITSNEEF